MGTDRSHRCKEALRERRRGAELSLSRNSELIAERQCAVGTQMGLIPALRTTSALNEDSGASSQIEEETSETKAPTCGQGSRVGVFPLGGESFLGVAGASLGAERELRREKNSIPRITGVPTCAGDAAIPRASEEVPSQRRNED